MTVAEQIAAAKQSISLLQAEIQKVDTQITRQKTVVEQSRPRSGGVSVEIAAARERETVAAIQELSKLELLKGQLLDNIEDLQGFISLDSELKRAQDINLAITTVRDSVIEDSRAKQELSAESRRIIAAFEAAKKDRVDSNDAQRLADQLAEEQRKAEETIFGILNPAIAERQRREEEAQIQQQNIDAFNARVQEQNEFFLDEQDRKRIADLQARFDNLPLDEFADKLNAERAAAKIAEEKVIDDEIARVSEQLRTKSTDENAKIRDTLDEFTKSIFGTPTTAEQQNLQIDEQKLANAYKDAQDLQVDDLVDAHFMKLDAAEEITALMESVTP